MAHPARKLALAPAARSPERVALANAVDRYNAAARALEINAKAREKSSEAIYDARAAVVMANAALEQAKVNAADMLAGVLRRPPRLTVKNARAELEAAEDTLAAVTLAETTLEQKHGAAEQAAMFAKMALDHRRRNVVQNDESTRKLLAAFERSHRETVGLRNALRFLDGKDLLPPDAKLWACERDDWPEQVASASRIKAWVASLETNPDAEAPL